MATIVRRPPQRAAGLVEVRKMLRFVGGGKLVSACPVLLFCCLVSVVLSGLVPAVRISDASSQDGEYADQLGGGIRMGRPPYRLRKVRARALFQFELLEPRHLFSAAPLEAAPPVEPFVEPSAPPP